MNNLGRNITVFLVVALVIGAAGYWFFTNFELRDVEKEGDYSRAARENRFLAMQYFLKSMDASVESVSGRELLDDLPPPTDTIFLSHSSTALSQRRQQALRAWLEQGGHLITVVSENWDEDEQQSGQQFFDDFGIQRHPHNSFTLDKENNDDEGLEFSFDTKQEDHTVSVNFSDYDQAVEVNFSDYAYLIDANEQASGYVADDSGNTLLQYQVGEGQLTVLTGLHFLNNNQIGEYDHALFSWLLFGEESNKIWVMYDISLPSLLNTVWNKAPYAVIACSILLIIWLWSLYNRFGPQHIVTQTGRRSLMEHLSASARFHWETNHAEQLLSQLQASMSLKLEHNRPEWPTLSEKQKGEWLARRTRKKPEQCLLALSGKANDERSFYQCVRTLQEIQKTL